MRAKHSRTAVPLIAVALLAMGCTIHDNDPPPVPSGVYSVTGDGSVEILWSHVRSDDLHGYRVYRSRSEVGAYRFIGGSRDNQYVDANVDNGTTYFYAVTSYDRHDNESELSYETVFDTPRPAGRGLRVYDDDDFAGVDFSDYRIGMVQPWDAADTDMYLLWLDGRYCFASTDVVIGDDVYGTDIQYAGYVETLDEIGWAPEGGWSQEAADTLVLYEGHAYLVWTWENHFAKFRVAEIGYDYVVVDWAFQVDRGNPELAVIAGEREGGAAAPKPPRQAKREATQSERGSAKRNRQ